MKRLTPGLLVAALVCLLGAVVVGWGWLDSREAELTGVSLQPRDAEQTASLLARAKLRVPLVLQNENRFMIRVLGDDAC